MKTKLLLLHGALGAASTMEPLADYLREYYDVYSYDFPGHGGKLFPEHPLTLPILAKHLHEYLREFDLVGCNVFGYSMGGYAALWLESKEQGTFNKIITLGTKFEWRPEVSEREIALLIPEKMEAQIPSFVKHFETINLPNDWKRVVKETAHLMEHLGKHHLTVDDFENVNCAVRLCLGDRDQKVSLDETVRTFKELPHASLCVFPETGHSFEKINYAYLSEEIHRFIS